LQLMSMYSVLLAVVAMLCVGSRHLCSAFLVPTQVARSRPELALRSQVHMMASGRQRAQGRPSLDDVERISFGKAAKKRGTGSRGVCHRLNADERAEWDLAKKRGYLVLRGTGYRKERKGSPLSNIFRQYCDAKAVPYVSIQQAVGIDAIDEVQMDLSPLRRRDLAEVKAEIDAIAQQFGAVKVEAEGTDSDPLQVLPPLCINIRCYHALVTLC
jgi:hypothetical protein